MRCIWATDGFSEGSMTILTFQSMRLCRTIALSMCIDCVMYLISKRHCTFKLQPAWSTFGNAHDDKCCFWMNIPYCKLSVDTRVDMQLVVLPLQWRRQESSRWEEAEWRSGCRTLFSCCFLPCFHTFRMVQTWSSLSTGAQAARFSRRTVRFLRTSDSPPFSFRLERRSLRSSYFSCCL